MRTTEVLEGFKLPNLKKYQFFQNLNSSYPYKTDLDLWASKGQISTISRYQIS